MILRGRNILLRPATREDARSVFEWLARSDLTPSMMGRPLFPEIPVPTWDQFRLDYPAHFFDGSQPLHGRSFIILAGGIPVGHINYDGMETRDGRTELDIWLRSSRDCGNGYGPDALATLIAHLSAEYGMREFILRPSRRNPRAIRAYERAGFRQIDMPIDEQTSKYGKGDYDDDVLLLYRAAGDAVVREGVVVCSFKQNGGDRLPIRSLTVSGGSSMKWKYVAGWCGLLVIAFINGAFRQAVFQESLGELHAHQLSTATGITLFAVYIRWIIKRWQPTTSTEAVRIGILWLVLTVLFETGMATLIQQRDWSSVVYDYNILEGRIWILVLAWVALAPSLFHRIHSRNKPAAGGGGSTARPD